MSSDINFTVTSWSPGNVRIKLYFNTQCPPFLVHVVVEFLSRKRNSPKVWLLGWAPWNLSCLQFKFDETRLSYWHKNNIGRNEIFLLLPDFANFLPCWLAQFCWDSQQGRELAKSGSNKKNFNSCVNRKVW